MSFQVDLRYDRGPLPPVAEDHIQKLRFKLADNNVIDTNDPLKVPASGEFCFSYWKQTFVYGITGGSTSINNLTVFALDSIDWTDMQVKVAQVDNYQQALGTDSSGYDAEDPSNGHIDLAGTTDMVNISDYDAENPLSLAGSLGANDADQINDGYILFQVQCSDGMEPGLKPAESVAFRFDVV